MESSALEQRGLDHMKPLHIQSLRINQAFYKSQSDGQIYITLMVGLVELEDLNVPLLLYER